MGLRGKLNAELRFHSVYQLAIFNSSEVVNQQIYNGEEEIWGRGLF